MGQSAWCLFMLISCFTENCSTNVMNDILTQKSLQKEDYYAVLGCDELSTVRRCFVFKIYQFFFIR